MFGWQEFGGSVMRGDSSRDVAGYDSEDLEHGQKGRVAGQVVIHLQVRGPEDVRPVGHRIAQLDHYLLAVLKQKRDVMRDGVADNVGEIEREWCGEKE